MLRPTAVFSHLPLWAPRAAQRACSSCTGRHKDWLPAAQRRSTAGTPGPRAHREPFLQHRVEQVTQTLAGGCWAYRTEELAAEVWGWEMEFVTGRTAKVYEHLAQRTLVTSPTAVTNLTLKVSRGKDNAWLESYFFGCCALRLSYWKDSIPLHQFKVEADSGGTQLECTVWFEQIGTELQTGLNGLRQAVAYQP